MKVNRLLSTVDGLKSQSILWIKRNYPEFYGLLFVLLIGGFLRLYRISEYMTFLGDEGRDAIVVRRLLVNFDPILIGPGTSIGNMYLGPLYYYFMAPWMLLFGLSPVGASIGVALLGVATIFLIWILAREWFGSMYAILASFLYAISPIVITYNRSSWNPNIMPFFALLCVYGMWRVWKNKEFLWLLIVGVSYAFVLQSHYLGLILLPILGMVWVATLLKLTRSKTKKFGDWKLKIGSFSTKSIFALLVFLFLMSPLVIFDARHGWNNFNAIQTFFGERETTLSIKPWSSFYKLPEVGTEIITRLLGGTNLEVGVFLSYLLSIGFFLYALQILIKLIKKSVLTTEEQGIFVLIIWAFIGVLGLAAYKQHIYDHYFGFLFPLPFLLFVGLSKKLISASKFFGVFVVGLLTLAIILASFESSPLRYPPNRQYQRTEAIAKKVYDESREMPFNFGLIAERNYDDAYQFFLELWGAPMVEINPLMAEITITDQLFVICENEKSTCNPTTNPKAEIANFGWSKIEEEWMVEGVVIYKLVHNTIE